MIKLVKGNDIPINIATQKAAFLGRTGSGKSYAARKMTEQLLDNNIQIVAIDPVGTWWGLRISADGKKKGYSIPIFGGDHGDVPINANSGSLIATIIVEKGISAIIDLSLMRKNERKQFMADFGEQFYYLKRRNKGPVHVFLDEAQFFVPQKVFKGEERMLGAWEDIIKVGRNFGIGISLISQRPQSVHKDCLNQTEALFVFQLNGPQERKAIEEWIVDKGLDRSTVREDVSGLNPGQCFLWSPQWLKLLKKVEILPTTTFDASKTPVVGAKTSAAKQLAPVDLEKIKQDVQQLIEDKNQNDPTVLRREIASLKKQLEKVSDVNPDYLAAIDKCKVLTGKLSEKQEELNFYVARCHTWDRLYQSQAQKVMSAFGVDYHSVVVGSFELKQEFVNLKKPYVASGKRQDPTPSPVSMHQPITQKIPFSGDVKEMVEKKPTIVMITPDENAYKPGKCERAILSVLAQRRGKGQLISKQRIAILSGYSPGSGSFNNSMSKLSVEKYIEKAVAGYMITTSGESALGFFEPLPTGPALHQYWYNNLGKCEREILKFLIDGTQHSATKQEISSGTGYSAISGSFNNALSRLRTMGLVEGSSIIKASDDLFE